MPEEYDINEISEPLKEIITVAQEKKVDTMRQRLNNDAFQLYAELFLKNVIRKRDWRLKKPSAKDFKKKNKHARRNWKQKRLNVFDLKL